tara:strand:+ start:2768 stop:3409 length:642 start_codon:yes stop_codon:yes gene_type:complete
MMNLETYNRIKKELGSEVGLIAVSKGQTGEKILSLYNQGHRDFGENFLQELVEKKNQLPDDIRWHFLGNIQSNKLPKIIESSYIIHSISRQKIYEILINAETNISTKILLQLKLGSEKTKGGFSENEIINIVKNHDRNSNVSIKGIMVISENNIDNVTRKQQFSQAKKLFEKIKKINNEIEILSMGMSNDYQVAISCDSNMVRLGTVIFGKRK